jgi:hypothetical protein
LTKWNRRKFYAYLTRSHTDAGIRRSLRFLADSLFSGCGDPDEAAYGICHACRYTIEAARLRGISVPRSLRNVRVPP